VVHAPGVADADLAADVNVVVAQPGPVGLAEGGALPADLAGGGGRLPAQPAFLGLVEPPQGRLLGPIRGQRARRTAAAARLDDAREYLTSAIEDRVVEALALLADHGQRRAPSVSDLFIAGTGRTRRDHRAALRRGLRPHC